MINNLVIPGVLVVIVFSVLAYWDIKYQQIPQVALWVSLLFSIFYAFLIYHSYYVFFAAGIITLILFIAERVARIISKSAKPVIHPADIIIWPIAFLIFPVIGGILIAAMFSFILMIISLFTTKTRESIPYLPFALMGFSIMFLAVSI